MDCHWKICHCSKKKELQDLYSHEIYFQGKPGDTNHIFRILPRPPNRGNERRRRSFPNAVPQLFQKPLSQKVYQYLVKYVMYLLGDLKSHITISVMENVILELIPIKPSMSFPMKYSLMTLGLFKSCGLRRKYPAKRVCVYTCCWILATQLKATSQNRTVPLIIGILHWPL